jgi:hypothetical protein
MNDELLEKTSRQYLPWMATFNEYQPAILHNQLASAWCNLESFRINGIAHLKTKGDINKLKMFLNRVSDAQNGIENMLFVLKKIAFTGMFEQIHVEEIQNIKASRTEYKDDCYPIDP